jgi:O-succinylbenzoate synthase
VLGAQPPKERETVRIDAVELTHIELPLKAPERTNYGVNVTRRVVLVSVLADGLRGWGEAAPLSDPTWNYEYPGTTWPILRDYLAPAVLGKHLAAPTDVGGFYAGILGRGIRGHHFAKAALEMAVWDVFAKAAGVPLSHLLGGTRSRVPVGVSIGIQDTPSDLVRVVGAFLDEGYQRVKIKIMPGRDVGDLGAVRREYPDAQVMTDANSGYTLADEFGLTMHEQPLGWDDIVDHAKLAPAIRTPICLDESILSPADARKAIELGACRYINVKIGRLGGHQACREVHDFMLARGLGVWCGGMYESGVGRAHNLHLASLPGYTFPGDTSASARYFREDIVDEPAVLNADGTVTVPTRPGIGVEVLPDVLKRYTLATWSARA